VPRDIAAGPGGTIWFTDFTTPAVGSITGGSTIHEFTNGLRKGAVPYAIIAGPDGAMWFSDESGAIGRIAADGSISEFRAGIPAGLTPSSLAVDASGSALWTVASGSSSSASVLLRIALDGAITSVPLPATLIPDGSIAIDAGGNVWFFAFGKNNDVVLAQRTKTGRLILNQTGLTSKGEPCCPNLSPNHIAIGADGNPWFTTPYFGPKADGQHVGTFANGRVVLFDVARGSIDYTAYPSGIVRSSSALWFSGSDPLSFNGALWRLTDSGRQTPYPIPYDPAGLTLATDGTLWFTSQAPGRVVQIVRAVFR